MTQASPKAVRAALLGAAVAVTGGVALSLAHRPAAPAPPNDTRLASGFGHLALARPASYANLTVYPVYSDGPLAGPARTRTAEFVTLAEGMDRGGVRVREQGCGCAPDSDAVAPAAAGLMVPAATVTNAQEGGEHRGANEMMATNVAPRPTYIPDGQVVPGGGQDRGAAADTIIPARSAQVSVPAFCIEAHRSSGPSAEFGKGIAIAIPSVRYAMQVVGEQQPVWDAVGAATRAGGARTVSGTYSALLQSPAARVSALPYATALTVPVQAGTPGRVIGVVAAINGRIVCADLYRDPALFAQMWPSLLRSYALQAALSRTKTPPAPARADEAARWLSSLDAAPGTPSRSCDLSRAARVRTPGGAGVRVEAVSADGGPRMSLLHEAFWTPAAVLTN